MSGKYKKSIIWAVIYILGLIKVGFIFSFYSDSGFCGRRPGRLDRSVKAFVDFIGSSPARKNKRFCFSLAYSKNSLTGGTPHFVRQTPPVGRSENLSGPVQANRSEDIKSGIGIERKNNSTFINVNMYITDQQYLRT